MHNRIGFPLDWELKSRIATKKTHFARLTTISTTFVFGFGKPPIFEILIRMFGLDSFWSRQNVNYVQKNTKAGCFENAFLINSKLGPFKSFWFNSNFYENVRFEHINWQFIYERVIYLNKMVRKLGIKGTWNLSKQNGVSLLSSFWEG